MGFSAKFKHLKSKTFLKHKTISEMLQLLWPLSYIKQTGASCHKGGIALVTTYPIYFSSHNIYSGSMSSAFSSLNKDDLCNVTQSVMSLSHPICFQYPFASFCSAVHVTQFPARSCLNPTGATANTNSFPCIFLGQQIYLKVMWEISLQ